MSAEACSASPQETLGGALYYPQGLFGHTEKKDLEKRCIYTDYESFLDYPTRSWQICTRTKQGI